MPRWTTTCHQALVEAPRKGRQGNKNADVNIKRNIQMTFGDTPPLKSANVDVRRRRRQRRNLWCPFVLTLHRRQQDLQVPCLMRSWPASTTSSRNSNVDAGRNMVTNVRPQPRRHLSDNPQEQGITVAPLNVEVRYRSAGARRKSYLFHTTKVSQVLVGYALNKFKE